MDRDKYKIVMIDLETMKEEMVKVQHFDDAKVISDALKHIRLLDTDVLKHLRKNKELIEAITTLTDQLDTKKNNLINFHSANILQGLLVRGSAQSDKDIIDRSIELARLMIERLGNEN